VKAPGAIVAAAAALAGAFLGAAHSAAAPPLYPAVVAGRALRFPADFGSHPAFRTEWWYVTGWLTTARQETLGFQITFFRTRPAVGSDNPSAFAPRQLLIAHCAISDPKKGSLWRDQTIRREGFGLAGARQGDTDVWIDGWRLQRGVRGYEALIDAEDFSLHLELAPTQPPLLNGDAGVSRKGPAPEAASYYYSIPHLKVSGTIGRDGRADTVAGEAWLDHEWSSEYLDSQATGWDWVGLDLDDGGALMAFRIRGADGSTRWAGATLRRAQQGTQTFGPDDIRFTPLSSWTSPHTGIAYPVSWRLRVGSTELSLEPLMDDQENDTRLSTGAIYWEGAVRAYESGRPAGRGYLELTGYGEPLRLR